MKKSAMIIINPTAGKEEAGKYEDKIKDTLKRDYEKILVKYTKGEGDAREFAKRASKDGFDLLVSLGGDGTVNEIVNGLAILDNPPLLGIIPMGTINNLAKSLEIPIETEEAIELLLSGVEREIDIGRVEDTYFVSSISIGRAAEAINEVKIEDKSKLGSMAYIVSIAKELMEDDIFPVEIQMDDKTWQGELALIIVGVADSLGGFKSILGDVEIGDGNFHILAIKILDIPKLMTMTTSLILGEIEDSDNVRYFTSKDIKIRALDKKVHGSLIDGEKGPNLPFELKVFPRHLTVITGLEDWSSSPVIKVCIFKYRNMKIISTYDKI